MNLLWFNSKENQSHKLRSLCVWFSCTIIQKMNNFHRDFLLTRTRRELQIKCRIDQNKFLEAVTSFIRKHGGRGGVATSKVRFSRVRDPEIGFAPLRPLPHHHPPAAELTTLLNATTATWRPCINNTRAAAFFFVPESLTSSLHNTHSCNYEVLNVN